MLFRIINLYLTCGLQTKWISDPRTYLDNLSYCLSLDTWKIEIYCIHRLFTRTDRAVFNWVSKVISELHWFCITSLSDWFKVLAAFSFWLAKVISLVLILRHSMETRSKRNKLTCSQFNYSSVGRALHRHRRCHGLESRWNHLNISGVYKRQLLKLSR